MGIQLVEGGMLKLTLWHLINPILTSTQIVASRHTLSMYISSCVFFCDWWWELPIGTYSSLVILVAISQWCKCNYYLVFYWWASSWRWIYLPLSMVLNVMCLKGLPLRSCSLLVERISCSFFVRRKLIYLNSRVAVAGEPCMNFSEDLTA